MGYQLIWEKHGVIKEFQGLLSADDMMNSLHDVHASPNFDTLRYAINDFRAVHSVDFSQLEVEYIAALDKAAYRTNPRIIVAVVTTDPTIRSAAETYAASPLSPYPTRIFDTLPDARRWIAATPI